MKPNGRLRRWVCTGLSLILGLASLASVVLSRWFYSYPEIPIVGTLVCAPLAMALGGMGRQASDDATGARLSASVGMAIGFLGLCLGLFMPAISYAGPAARGAQFMTSLKQVALALHNYHEREGRFPPAVVRDRDGLPLYSWRVLILPYIEAAELHREFRLDEPWDSPHNLTLLRRMPMEFSRPGDDSSRDGLTSIEALTGPGAAFEGEGQPWNLPDGRDNFPDGQDETILVVEAEQGVPWTSPTAISIAPGESIPPLGGGFSERRPLFRPRGTPETFHAGLVNSSVRRLKRSLGEAKLRALFTRNGGEPRVMATLP